MRVLLSLRGALIFDQRWKHLGEGRGGGKKLWGRRGGKEGAGEPRSIVAKRSYDWKGNFSHHECDRVARAGDEGKRICGEKKRESAGPRRCNAGLDAFLFFATRSPRDLGGGLVFPLKLRIGSGV